MDHLPPLFFHPIYKDYLWGGEKIPHFFHRKLPPGIYAESWELSDREEGMSKVRGGPLHGKALYDLLLEKKPLLLGEDSHFNRFPLLIKLIDANQNLSIQVHPDNQSAKTLGGEPKTEAWYIIEADNTAKVYAGFKQREEKKKIFSLLSTKKILTKMHTIPIAADDLIYIPGGRLHAIGEGVLLFEIQQNSNTTYRIYDWDRVDQKGQRRALHLEEAKEVIHWEDTSFPLQIKQEIEKNEDFTRWNLITSPYFTLEKWEVNQSLYWEKKKNKFEILFFLSGYGELQSSYNEEICMGTTLLLPAKCAEVKLEIKKGPLTLLRSFIT